MGRQSRRHREKREKRNQRSAFTFNGTNPEPPAAFENPEEKSNRLTGREAMLRIFPDRSAGVRESDLEDILAFESVGSRMSLFEGLQQHGLVLPAPEELDELQSAKKIMEVFRALEHIRVFLIGFDEMTARELYSVLWNRTLWEGCYVKKRNPAAITLIDVSRKMKRSEIQQFFESLAREATIH